MLLLCWVCQAMCSPFTKHETTTGFTLMSILCRMHFVTSYSVPEKSPKCLREPKRIQTISFEHPRQPFLNRNSKYFDLKESWLQINTVLPNHDLAVQWLSKESVWSSISFGLVSWLHKSGKTTRIHQAKWREMFWETYVPHHTTTPPPKTKTTSWTSVVRRLKIVGSKHKWVTGFSSLDVSLSFISAAWRRFDADLPSFSSWWLQVILQTSWSKISASATPPPPSSWLSFVYIFLLFFL